MRKAVQHLIEQAVARWQPLTAAGPAPTVQLQRRALYILPTREGVYYGAMLAVMLLAATNYANGLAYALTFMLAAIGVVGILHTHRNLAGLRLSTGPAPPVFAGSPAVFTLIAHNDGPVPRRAVELAAGAVSRRFDVPARASTAVSLAVPTARRGYLAAPPLRVRTRFPLGLWHAWSRHVALPAECLVYPRPAPERPLPDAPGSFGGGEHGRYAEGEDFTGLREFRHGDPMQRVAWKKAAAGQGWHTKQFSAPAARVVWLEWDALSGLDVEERLSVLCRWVLMAENQGLAYGLRLPGASLAPGIGPAHRDACLERLALFRTP